MKTVFDFAWCARCQPKSWIASLAFALVVTAGCGKSSSSAGSVTPSASTDSASVQTPATAPVPQQNRQPVTSASPDDTQTMLQGLNRALMGWMIRNHRHPSTFEEFASSANMQIPDPPAGKKYALSARGFVVLVNN
jgi:hypothetical protein